MGLVSSVADLAALFLGARILLHFFQIQPGLGLLGQVGGLIYGITNPLVRPFEEFVPWLIVAGMPFDLPALVVMLLTYLAAGALVQAVSGRSPRSAGRGNR